MLRELLSRTPVFDLPLIATLLFVVFFLGVLVRVSRRSRAPEYQRMSRLPLADDQQPRRDA